MGNFIAVTQQQQHIRECLQALHREFEESTRHIKEGDWHSATGRLDAVLEIMSHLPDAIQQYKEAL